MIAKINNIINSSKKFYAIIIFLLFIAVSESVADFDLIINLRKVHITRDTDGALNNPDPYLIFNAFEAEEKPGKWVSGMTPAIRGIPPCSTVFSPSTITIPHVNPKKFRIRVIDSDRGSMEDDFVMLDYERKLDGAQGVVRVPADTADPKYAAEVTFEWLIKKSNCGKDITYTQRALPVTAETSSVIPVTLDLHIDEFAPPASLTLHEQLPSGFDFMDADPPPTSITYTEIDGEILLTNLEWTFDSPPGGITAVQYNVMTPALDSLLYGLFGSAVEIDTIFIYSATVDNCIRIGQDSFDLMPQPAIRIEKKHNAFQGHYESISIMIDVTILDMGGFDFLIAYDAAALAFIEAQPGQLLEDCDWEYFSYRHGANGNCGDACPSGLLRIVAIAETNDGPNHPSCSGPPDNAPHELANLKFYVSNDRTFECQNIPIYFFWGDCGDNTVSSVSGDTLYINHSIHNYDGNLIWNEEDDDQFPEDARIPFVGAPDYCLNPDPEKPTAIRFIDFVNGGIDIICADSIDVRGDINLNGAAYEIADAIVLTNYFIYGLAAFTINQEGQIAATDVNADGMVLSVADLTYLIRVIIGDALPYAKIAPLTAKYDIKDGILSVDQEMGAAYVTIKGNAIPGNLTKNMEMKYAYDSENDVTRAMLYSMEKDHRFAGEFLELNGTLIEIEMATYEGATVKLTTDLLPTEYVLHQNKPNPFNPITNMSFSLPAASDVTLEIYNITGQKVATVADGRFEAGTHTVRWDGSNYASGIYMYRITAGNFTDSKKMLLLK